MTSRSVSGPLAIGLAVATTAGCVVVPMPVYVADDSAGTPIHERCSLVPELPVGVKVERPQLVAIVSIVPGEGLVRVRYDVPEGTTIVLRENTIRIDPKDGRPPRAAAFASVNPAAPARVPETPTMQKLTLPVDSPLRGGHIVLPTVAFDRHYWVAAPFDAARAPEVWITLPEVLIDGKPSHFDEIRFTRRLAIGRAFFNC